VQETFFTLPLRQGWREPVKLLPYWEKTYGLPFKIFKPRIFDPILQILAHPKTEEALVRLIKISKGKLPVNTFCDALVTCNLYLFSKGYAGNKRRSINWGKNEFRRMAENARELHVRIPKILDSMDPLRTRGKPLSKGSMELWGKGYYKDAEFGGDQLDDEKILYALNISTKFLDKLARPEPSNRPQEIFLNLLLSDLENKFRKHFNGRPLYPVIADLVQATTDVMMKGNNRGERTDSAWTTSRVITRIKRYRRQRGVDQKD